MYARRIAGHITRYVTHERPNELSGVKDSERCIYGPRRQCRTKKHGQRRYNHCSHVSPTMPSVRQMPGVPPCTQVQPEALPEVGALFLNQSPV